MSELLNIDLPTYTAVNIVIHDHIPDIDFNMNLRTYSALALAVDVWAVRVDHDVFPAVVQH
jgi:hypothetical protein